MVPIITLTFVIGFSMLVTKIATIALVHTGMTRERARFQARSAFSGAGFTTTESEVVVKHPARRRIITILIITGNAGLVTAVSSLILGFVGPETQTGQLKNIALLFLGLALLFMAAKSQRLDQLLSRIISRLLKRFTDIPKSSVSRLMSLMEDYEITETQVEGENDWLSGKTLVELGLKEEGVLVLGIIKDDGTYLGVPRGRYKVEKDDRLVLYGKSERIAKISRREADRKAEEQHEEAKEEHEEEMKEQDRQAEESEKE